MNKELKYQSLSHWGLHPIEEKEELKHMSDFDTYKELSQFVADYKTNRKFKTGDHVLYNDYNLGWVPAIIMKKYSKTDAGIAYAIEDEIRLATVHTNNLMKAPVKVTGVVGGSETGYITPETLDVPSKKFYDDLQKLKANRQDVFTLTFCEEYPSGFYRSR